MDLLSDLTPPQREAVTHVDGPLLVLAGAGSGKTRVITRRVAYLVSQGIPPWQILAITFTNKAAGEMRERIHSLVEPRGLTVATFHSFCARALRMHGDLVGVARDFTIYAGAEQKRALKRAIQAAGLDTTNWTPEKMGGRISHLKNRMETAEAFAETAGDFTGKNVAKVYTGYETVLRENNAMDFDDLLMRVAMALRDNGAFRNVLQDRYRYILIDEYQDTNDAQYGIAETIAERHKNICATGDPDQSIYGWRGANLNNILDFEKDFAGCKVVRLEENWRSTPQILGAASSLIARNAKRKAKNLWTRNADGPPVQVVESASGDDEARRIAEEIARAFPDGKGIGGVAVFYRVNALSRAVEDALRTAGIAYEIVRGTSFYERQEVRNLVAYLRVLSNPADDLALERVINTPTRGLGATTIKRLQAFAAERGIALLEACRAADSAGALTARARSALKKFVALIDELLEQDRTEVRPLVEHLIEAIGYEAYCKKLSDGDDERWLNVGEFVNIATAFDAEMLSVEETELAEAVGDGYPLLRFLERVSLTSDQDAVHEDQERVHLMTLHAAKGLEFPVVYIVGLEKGLLPHIMAEEADRDVEEERRLCFVGITRAKERLTLLHARYRMHRGQTLRQAPSAFLTEIGAAGVQWRELPAEAIAGSYGGRAAAVGRGAGGGATRRWKRKDEWEYSQESPEDQAIRAAAQKAQADCPYRSGQRVRHRTYGVGTIVGVSGAGDSTKVTIDFSHLGPKTFAVQHAKLEILS